MSGSQEARSTTVWSPDLEAARESAETAHIEVDEVLDAFRTPGPNRPPCDVSPVVRRLPGRAEDIPVSPCPVCGDTWAQPLFEIDGGQRRLAICADCGLGRLWPLPTPDELAGFYPPEYYGAAGAKFRPLVERVVRGIAAQRATRLARGLPSGARVLDIGCGRGVLLSALADRGCEVHGFEIGPTAALGADPRANVRIANELAAARYAANSFDQVILCHVLEHLPCPRETLLEIRRILKPGGRLLIAVPNFASLQARWAGADWFHLDLPRHLYHFPLPALVRLLDGCGLDVECVRHLALDQNVFGWLQSLLNRFSRSAPNRLYRLLKNGRGGRESSSRLAHRWRTLGASALWAPVTLLLSVLEAALGCGGTVTLSATRRLRTQSAGVRPTETPAWTRLLGPTAAVNSCCGSVSAARERFSDKA